MRRSERCVFGAPTFAVHGRLFWSDDAKELFVAFLYDLNMLERPAFVRVAKSRRLRSARLDGRERGRLPSTAWIS
jgi:hypothetical protein